MYRPIFLLMVGMDDNADNNMGVPRLLAPHPLPAGRAIRYNPREARGIFASITHASRVSLKYGCARTGIS
jgi:hypothetical protein